MPLVLRRLTDADDLDGFGRMVLSSYHALAGHPPDADYDDELADVAGRVRDGIVLGAFDSGVPVGCVTYVNDPSSPHAERLGDDEASFRMLAVVQRCAGTWRRQRPGDVMPRPGQGERTRGRVHPLRSLDGDRPDGSTAGWASSAFPERDWPFSELGFTLLGFRREL